MKLTDLNPRWVGLTGWSSPHPFFIGVSFDSPATGQRLAVLFDPPIDPASLSATMGPVFPAARKWQRTGDTFDTLTLSPSIDTSHAGDWHGFITNGEVR